MASFKPRGVVGGGGSDGRLGIAIIQLPQPSLLCSQKISFLQFGRQATKNLKCNLLKTNELLLLIRQIKDWLLSKRSFSLTMGQLLLCVLCSYYRKLYCAPNSYYY